MWFKSNGIIRYDPVRTGINSVDRNGRTNRDKWWVIVQADPEICRYYRYQVNKFILNPLGFENRKDALKHGFHFIDQPSWGAHSSILRGERPQDDLLHLWKKYDRQEIEFEYSHDVERAGNYFFIKIRSEFLTNIRKEFGLPIKWKFHMTVGRIWND